MAKKLLSVPPAPPKARKTKKNGAQAGYWQSLSETATPDEYEALAPLVHGTRRESIHRKIQ